MLKTRVILLVSAILLVVLVFSLPKVVVDNKENDLEESTSQTNDDQSVEAAPAIHNEPASEEEQERIARIKLDYYSSNNIEKSIIFADSLARLYLRINKYDSAAKFIEIIAENNPNKDNWLKAGNTYYDAFGYAMTPQKRAFMGQKAREYFDKVLEESPNDLEVKNKIAMTYLSTSNPMKGILMLREILQDDPANQDAMFNLGVLSMQSNQYDKAVERFSNLVRMYPDNTQAQFFLGVSYLETGNKEKAKEQFELVKKLDDDPEVQATADSYLEDIK